MTSSTTPTLHTKRLILRPFSLADVPAVVALAGDWDIAFNTLSVPHPYTEDHAVQWIRQQNEQWKQKQAVTFAIAQADNTLVGSIGLGLVPSFNLAELGYWVGKPYWGRGYATEAACAVVDFGFEKLSLHRIQATHFGNNPASGKVMQKVGLLYEGCRRQHTLKWDEYRDIKLYGMLREDWQHQAGASLNDT
jgi:RimJ/RimL family protein N-acetyltransferase